jgi:hypothetical protein
MKQDNPPEQASDPQKIQTPPPSFALPIGAILAVITALIGILSQVLIGFLLTRMHELPLPSTSTTLTSLTKAPMVGLGIAWLVSILAHAVGLFLQQEDFSNASRSADDGNDEESPKPPSLYPGYTLALIAFAVSALAGVACILAAGVLLLALLAYYRDLWQKPVLGPVVLAGSRAVAVLLGAAAGGWRGQSPLMPELLLACVALAAYTWASEATTHKPPRRGLARWRVTIVSAVVGLTLVIYAFCRWGMEINPWLVVLLTIWLTARSASLSVAMGTSSGPQMEQALTRQFQRGELLLLAGIVAALLPEWQGTIAFGAVFVLFPVAALLDRR